MPLPVNISARTRVYPFGATATCGAEPQTGRSPINISGALFAFISRLPGIPAGSRCFVGFALFWSWSAVSCFRSRAPESSVPVRAAAAPCRRSGGLIGGGGGSRVPWRRRSAARCMSPVSIGLSNT
jgi:hypothetical protein